jgi:hypothetical protein
MKRRCAIVLALAAAALPAAAQTSAMLTIADGKVSLVRGAEVYAPRPGIRIEGGDILSTGSRSLAQVELADGTLVAIGPETRAMLVSAPSPRIEAQVAVLGGWLKIAAGKPARALRCVAPGAQVTTSDAATVLRFGPLLTEAFVESGSIRVNRSERGGNPIALKSGQFLRLGASGPPSVGSRPARDFVEAMPIAFRDPLPQLMAKYRDRPADARREREASYADVSDWLNSSLALRHALVRRFAGRAHDPEFHAGLVKDMRHHPEWDRVLFPEKYETPPPPAAAAQK